MKSIITEKYNRDSFLRFLRTFLPEDYTQNVVARTYSEREYTRSVTELGKCDSLEVIILEVHHSSSNDARVGIAKETFRLMKDIGYQRALVVFVPEGSDQWRFSLLEITLEWDDLKVTRSYSNPRRHSYLLGEGGSLTTPQKYLFDMGRIAPRKDGNKQLSAVEDLQSRFSVEALTKEFYNKLYNWYLWAVEPSTGVTFPNLVNTSKDDRDDIAIKIIRLITRLLFVWFIKQKGLVPKEIFDEDELKRILANFNPQSEKDGKYYNAILQNLFFATLNNEVSKRRFMSEPFQGKSNSFGVKTLFRDSLNASWFAIPHDEVIKRFHNVPFMNCGLFECLDKYAKSDIGQEEDMFLDGFSSRDGRQDGHLKYRAFVPNRLFFAEEHNETVTVEEDKKQKKVSIPVMGLLPLLKLYNFTVQENTPSEVEVSLDPELLGQVFENLLAAYNPETKESARKSTGSFYTPRPIVEYMVNESLIEYLKTKVTSVAEENWRALISYDDVPFTLSDNERIATLNALYECKILDPACGSGAFPMGMLQQMVHITRKLDSEFDPYQTKLRIINNCIYGSDIQPIAMLISKLRFFISLICEQDDKAVNFDDEENNFGINTLPNLETKFVAANSLLTADIHRYADDNWTLDPNLIKLKNELLKIRQEHFSVRTQTTKLRKREEDRLKRQEIQDYILQSTTQPNAELVQMYESRIRHLLAERDLYEGEKIVEEFVDTQASLFDETKPQLVRKDINKIQRDRIDAEIADLRRSIAKEQNKRNPVGFNAAIKQIADWNPYDQLKAAPFFDADWMFGVKDGFDIVIGNPPYISALEAKKVLPAEVRERYKEIYTSATGTYDMYVIFIELGLKLLVPDGVLSFITPSKYLSAEYATSLRSLIIENYSLNRISDFSNIRVFESAGVSTMISQFSNSSQHELVEFKTYATTTEVASSHIYPSSILSMLPGNLWGPLLTKEIELFLKIYQHSDVIENHADVNACSTASEAEDFENSLTERYSKDAYKFINNGTINRYTQYWGFKPIKTNRLLKPYLAHKYLSQRRLDMFALPKLIFVKLAKCPQVFYDEFGEFASANTNMVYNLEDYDYKFLVGYLNSRLFNFVYHTMFGGLSMLGTVQIQAPQIKKSLVPILTDYKAQQKGVIKLADQILQAKRVSPQADTTELENQIDILVYLLYKLTYEEVRIIDPQIDSIISEQEYNKRLANA